MMLILTKDSMATLVHKISEKLAGENPTSQNVDQAAQVEIKRCQSADLVWSEELSNPRTQPHI